MISTKITTDLGAVQGFLERGFICVCVCVEGRFADFIIFFS